MVARALVLALAAGLGSSALAAAAEAGPSYLSVQSFTARPSIFGLVKVSATTNAFIPYRPDAFIRGNAIVGIAWVDGDTLTALVATIHPAFMQDSKWPPGVWHLHTVQLAAGSGGDNDLCLISVPTSPLAPVWIFGKTMTAWLPASQLPNPGSGAISIRDIDFATGFTVHGDGGCSSGFGVRVRT